jgi:acyl-CoA thioesterase FadM
MVAIFMRDDELARAQGTFTTVTTSKQTGRPVEVPSAFRQAHDL